MTALPIPEQPLRVALIGCGQRSQTIYAPLFPSLAPWLKLVAVCDPVQPNAAKLAGQFGVPAYLDLRALVQDRPMEAALVVTPPESHHSISVFLSTHGIHNLVETLWASMFCQTQEMVRVAREHRVITRVAENFFRMPIDRFAQTVRDHGYLGRIGRIVSYADHTGYHNNSRWIAFARAHPSAVQCIEHAVDHPAFYSMPQRRHTTETLKARFFFFPDNFLVTDIGSGHAKGHLGRHPRPGYTEWQGERGTLVHRAGVSAGWGDERTELRRCSDAKLAPAQEAAGNLWGGGVADVITTVVHERDGQCWVANYADTPQGRIEYRNPLRVDPRTGQVNGRDWYGTAVMDHVVDFVLAVRGLRPSEFTDEDALQSEMMEIGARESALEQGRRIALPLTGNLESDAIIRANQQQQYGVDPLDVEAMLAISFPRP